MRESESWQQIKEIVYRALQREPHERDSFLARECAGDDDLRKEVESLLMAHDEAESFFEAPAAEIVAEAIANNQSDNVVGKSLGRYQVIKSLGAGGMGEVYLAEDTLLKRRVAVKLLNNISNKNQDHLRRFFQEARSASALNHPNILTIHEIGEAGETRYIVSEFIEGKTLREIILEKSLQLPEILDIAIQIANALSAAHAAHIVHRDIKPENIMIRPDGFVKVLDFGLAKLIEQKNLSILGLEKSTVKQNETAKGVILGTVQYMSPEQAKGEKVDARTDIFSFGVLIYEMIAGRTPFAGESVPETLANLINTEPKPLSQFASNVPNELQRIVSEMLRKNKDERYQTMKGLLADLKEFKENLSFAEK